MTDKPPEARVALVDAAGRSRAAAEPTGTATACFELHGAGPETRPAIFAIQLLVNVNTYPFIVLEGSVSGGICQVPGTAWKVTDGSFGPQLFIEAKRMPLPIVAAEAEAVLGGPCSQTVSISGNFQAPDSYAGVYGWDGDTAAFIHTTLFKGWQACS
jgi:hypothetical protein